MTAMTGNIHTLTEKQNYIPLRAHHLFCTVLFQGKGYSEEFTREMMKIVTLLKESDLDLVLLAEPDKICSHCPNLKQDSGCALDEEKTDVKNINTKSDMKSTDSIILRHFGFPSGKRLPKAAVFQKIKNIVTKDFFELCCHECRWYKQGLCSYEQYKEALEKIV